MPESPEQNTGQELRNASGLSLEIASVTKPLPKTYFPSRADRILIIKKI